jgi:hypothetical protein
MKFKLLAYHSYRKAFVRGEGVNEYPIEFQRSFAEALCRLSGNKIDKTNGNHVCYLYELEGFLGKKIIKSIMFTDESCFIGEEKNLDIKNW